MHCSNDPWPQIRLTSARQFIPVPESPPASTHQSEFPPLQTPTTFMLHFPNEKNVHKETHTNINTVLSTCFDYLAIKHDKYQSVHFIAKHYYYYYCFSAHKCGFFPEAKLFLMTALKHLNGFSSL